MGPPAGGRLDPGGSIAGRRMELAGISLIDGVNRKLQPRGHTDLIEDAKQIIPYGVLAEAELVRNVAIREALGDKLHDTEFALGQKMSALGIYDRGGCAFRQRLDGKLQLLAVCPHLALVHSLNAPR